MGSMEKVTNQYDDFYDRKDFAHFKRDREYVHILSSFLADPGKSSVLDVGCGRGYWCQLFQEFGLYTIGIDLSLVGLKKARQDTRAGEFLLANASRLPFSDNAFDMIFCQGLSAHNTHDLSEPQSIGLELLRCLKENGLFVIGYSTNLSGKTQHGWINHGKKTIVGFVESLACKVEATYFIDRAVLLRLLGRNATKKVFCDYGLPIACRITGLPGLMICIGRKKTR